MQTNVMLFSFQRNWQDRIKDRAQVPVIALKNFMNKAEVEEKTLGYLESLK